MSDDVEEYFKKLQEKQPDKHGELISLLESMRNYINEIGFDKIPESKEIFQDLSKISEDTCTRVAACDNPVQKQDIIKLSIYNNITKDQLLKAKELLDKQVQLFRVEVTQYIQLNTSIENFDRNQLDKDINLFIESPSLITFVNICETYFDQSNDFKQTFSSRIPIIQLSQTINKIFKGEINYIKPSDFSRTRQHGSNTLPSTRASPLNSFKPVPGAPAFLYQNRNNPLNNRQSPLNQRSQIQVPVPIYNEKNETNIPPADPSLPITFNKRFKATSLNNEQINNLRLQLISEEEKLNKEKEKNSILKGEYKEKVQQLKLIEIDVKSTEERLKQKEIEEENVNLKLKNSENEKTNKIGKEVDKAKRILKLIQDFKVRKN